MRRKLQLLVAVFLIGLSAHADVQLTQDPDGNYLIGTPEELVAFSKLVNTGSRGANAVLTQDIDMSGVENFEPIGTYINKGDLANIGITIPQDVNFSYEGTFDGRGFVVKNVTIKMTTYAEAGLFSRIWNGAVKNLGVENISIEQPLQIRVGALAGFIYNSTAENCWVCGNISYQTEFANLNGFSPSTRNSKVTNCWSTYEGPFSPETSGSFENVHCYENNANIVEDAKSGALCYALNEGAGVNLFFQNLGEDNYPTMDPSHKVVYVYGTMNCDGTIAEGSGYSNEDLGFVKNSHEFDEDGFCSVCGEFPQDENGWYNIPSPKALIKFAEMVNAGKNTLKGRLTKDIDMSEVENFTPIGLYRDASPKVDINFRGEFDGGRHVISNLTINTEEFYEAGLFSRVYSGKISNLGIENVTVISNNADGRVGGVAGFNREGTITNCWTAGAITLTSTSEGTQVGSIAGMTNNNKGKFVNCWSTYEGPISNGSGSMTDCHSFATNPNIVYDAMSGALCYQLNKGSFINPEWRQNIDSDVHPSWNTEKDIVYYHDEQYENFNPQDESSFADFLDAVIELEKAIYPETTLATQSLLDEYYDKLDSWTELESYEIFCTEYPSINELKTKINTSVEAYKVYVEACEFAQNYLAENDFTNDERTLLETYLNENEEPSDEFANGTYQYIIEYRELTTQDLTKETAFVNIMLQKAISGGFVPGTEITVTLVNSNFEEGLEGWTVETTNEGVMTGGVASVLPVARGLNTTFTLSQRMTKVPNGIYAFSVNGFSRAGENVTSTFYSGQLFLNGNMNYLMSVNEDIISADDAVDGENCNITGPGADIEYPGEIGGYIPDSMDGCSYAFNSNRYLNYTAVEVTDSTLELGVRNPGTGLPEDWTPFGNVRVYYLGSAAEAADALDPVLESYVARANTILAFPWSFGDDYAEYPNMSESLKTQLDALVSEAESAASGEAKMSLINQFSVLFNDVYECRMAYIAMAAAAEALVDKAVRYQNMLEYEEYERLIAKAEGAWEYYQGGVPTTEEALELQKELMTDMQNTGLKQNENGDYLLSTPSDLIAFSLLVNSGDTKANALLTQNIDMTGVENFEPIGTYINKDDLAAIGITIPEIINYSYAGTFDGQGFVVSNLNVKMATYAEGGFFSRVWNGTVKNLGIENISIEQPLQIRVGALAGFIYHSTVENCWVGGNINYQTAYTNLNGFSPSARNSNIINCWSTYEGNFTPENNGTRKNVHCYDTNANIVEDARTGALCYALNQGADETVYYQRLGEDSHPVLDPTHGEVFLATDQNCDGTFKGEAAYSNTVSGTRDEHVTVDGICSACGKVPQAEDKFFEISTPAALVWYANWVNTTDRYAKGRLTQDIDMSSVDNFTPIGLYRDASPKVDINFRGEFDGGRHVISNLTIHTEEFYEAGLFSRIYGGKVWDLGIENVTVSSNNSEGRVGGLAGFNREGTITNCWTAGVITLTSTAEEPGKQIGGLVGNTNNNKGKLINCWSTYEGELAPGSGTITNSYAATAEEAASGVLCYNLNTGAGETIYYQTLGTDAHPVFDASHGEVIRNEDGTFGNTTGIVEVPADGATQIVGDNAIYDLQGRKITTMPKRGIYIRNGKKFFVK